MKKSINPNNRKLLDEISLHDSYMNEFIYDKCNQRITMMLNSPYEKNKIIKIVYYNVSKFNVNDTSHLYAMEGKNACEIFGWELIKENEDKNSLLIRILFFIGSEMFIKFEHLEYEVS